MSYCVLEYLIFDVQANVKIMSLLSKDLFEHEHKLS